MCDSWSCHRKALIGLPVMIAMFSATGSIGCRLSGSLTILLTFGIPKMVMPWRYSSGMSNAVGLVCAIWNADCHWTTRWAIEAALGSLTGMIET